MTTNEIKYSYAYFDVLNFTNEFSTSGYALSICPFTFKPKLDEQLFSNKRILWDFGDKTTSKSITATHYYKLPGEYDVSLYLFDGDNEAYYDTFTQKVVVYNFVNDSIILSAGNLQFYTSSNKDKFNVLRFNSWQSYNALSAVGYSIALSVSGNNAPFITAQQYNLDKYAHLKKYSNFYQYLYNADTRNYDYVTTDIITTDNVELYAKIDNNALAFCSSTDANAAFVGTSGAAIAVYEDDVPTSTQPTLIFAHFDNVSFDTAASPSSTASTMPPVLTNAQSFYCTISALSATGMSITSTGLSSMQINSTQFIDTRIPFVVQIIDENDSPCKHYKNLKRISNNDALSANTIQINFVDASTNTGLTGYVVDDFGVFENDDVGIYKGYCMFTDSLSGVKISATAYVSSGEFEISQLSAQSTTFSVINNNYNVAKINEDFDQAATYKSYRFQESLLDKNVFFDDFLGTIVGNVSANTNALGKRIHEKIANFTSNTQDANLCNIAALNSLKQLLDINIKQFSANLIDAPANLSRLIDILSIKQSKLWGHNNEFAENFDKRGIEYSNTWGTNLGSQLNSQTTILTAGSASKSIIAYEKFSNTYRLINTDALSSNFLEFIDNDNQTYALSTYNDKWGWGLVLPVNFNAADFDKYYLFYEYVDARQTLLLDSIINWDDINTTITRTASSYTEWTRDNGTVQTLLANSLFSGLDLFASVPGASALVVPV